MAYRTSATVNTDSGTTLAVPSTGVVSGDRVFAMILFRGATVSTVPSGWTQKGNELLLYNNTGTPLNARAKLYELTAGGSEPATWDWVIGNSNKHMAMMIAFSSVTGTSVSGETTNGTDSSTIAAASVTAPGSGNCDLAVFVGQTNQTTFTPPGSITQRQEATTSGGTDATAAFLGSEVVAAGATGTRTVTDDNGGAYSLDRMIAFTVAVEQTGGGGGSAKNLTLLGVG
jgi:hypothetical protein